MRYRWFKLGRLVDCVAYPDEFMLFVFYARAHNSLQNSICTGFFVNVLAYDHIQCAYIISTIVSGFGISFKLSKRFVVAFFYLTQVDIVDLIRRHLISSAYIANKETCILCNFFNLNELHRSLECLHHNNKRPSAKLNSFAWAVFRKKQYCGIERLHY